MTDASADLPVRTIDGARFADFEGFAREFSRLLDDYRWQGNLDAFNDILGGGFGRTCHPSNRSAMRARIASAERGEGPTLFDEIVELIRRHAPRSAGGIHLELR
ncbi:barnase inhibitor [Amycolatopsis nalaikhensis]|uniref:Barnase inhibitor n=1 Tax=Amycolatopsis nalaikhensis TaxID=715472 RepID=A0ABY8XKB6_9PSEU|nr:barnase inhibitor [Amycolatopsis sp. 2-2]WIV56056.1 barnase inhibitor [Amycolatopsis sp. 2-2]